VGGRAAGERESGRERLSGAMYRKCSLHKLFSRREQVGGDSKSIRDLIVWSILGFWVWCTFGSKSWVQSLRFVAD
jgi:hypothetical protein